MSTKNRTLGLQLGTSNSTIYTTPTNWEGSVTSIIITNLTGSTKTVSLDWYESASTTYYAILKLTPVPPNGIIQITDPLWLSQGDTIRGLASASASITVSIRVEELFSPTQF